MCGIAGVISTPAAVDGRDTVDRIVRHQHARGPDHSAIATIAGADHRVVFGHNRLAIVDLSPRSDQPFWDSARTCCLVFNGEIYNYRELRDTLIAEGRRFTSDGDTEVLAHAFRHWGPAGFERLNGMFAFALYDVATERLYLVRDRFGVKPLYYHSGGDRLSFASSPEVIAHEHGLGPNLGYAARGIRQWIYEDADVSPFEGVRAVPPGHFLLVQPTASGLSLASTSYYDLGGRVTTLARQLGQSSEAEILERLEDLLARAVSLRARPDATVGISLSGGLDSSTLATLIRAHGPVLGFTFGDPEDRCTEAPVVKKLIEHSGLQVVFVDARGSDLSAAYFATLAAQGAPFPTGSIVAQYLVYRAAREHGIRVMLAGQGGDEVFMGYRKFQVFRLRQLVHERRSFRALAFLASLIPDALAEMHRAASYWRLRRRYTSTLGMSTSLDLPDTLPPALSFDPDRPLWVRQLQDLCRASLPTLLRYEDRNSMAHSVESRLPYLDHPLVEFALALPVSLKLRHGYRKWIMREFARGRIPDAIRKARYKRGFDVQQAAWIRRGLGAAMRRALRERLPEVRQHVRASLPLERLYSDDRLAQDPVAFGEVTTLLWLSDVARGTVGIHPEPA